MTKEAGVAKHSAAEVRVQLKPPPQRLLADSEPPAGLADYRALSAFPQFCRSTRYPAAKSGVLKQAKQAGGR